MEGVLTYDGDMIKLNVNNYSYWKVIMEDYLIYKDLAEPILNKNMREGKKDNEWKLLNHKAIAIIRKYIARSLFEHVSNFGNVCELWTKLESLI